MALKKSFVPHSHLIYPEITDQHYLKVDNIHKVTLDKDYPYIDKSKSFRFKQFLVRIVIFIVVFPTSRIRFGLRIRGRKNIRKNKKLFKKGVISICNHVNLWDYLMIMRGILPFKPRVLVWDKNMIGKDGPLIRMVGGIPIPTNDPQATLAYLNTIKEYLDNGGWLHIYPEGSMWEYYRPIRPFKKGVAHLARLHDKPVLPMAISYRKPGWIRSTLFRQNARYNLCIGEPIFINKDLDIQEQEIDLLKRCHEAVLKLAGLTEYDNGYESIFNNSKKIDF